MSLKIYVKPTGVLRANSYLVTKDDKTAVAIDCGGAELFDYAKEKNLEIRYILLTHGHFDHIAGCASPYVKNVKIGASVNEVKLINSADNLANDFGVELPEIRVSFTFADGDVLNLCGMQFKVIATPGHTAGGVCFKIENNLFTGDTLFCESVGRTDFPTGDSHSLISSIKEKLFTLEDCIVYPGHEEGTTLSHEKKYNFYIR